MPQLKSVCPKVALDPDALAAWRAGRKTKVFVYPRADWRPAAGDECILTSSAPTTARGTRARIVAIRRHDLSEEMVLYLLFTFRRRRCVPDTYADAGDVERKRMLKASGVPSALITDLSDAGLPYLEVMEDALLREVTEVYAVVLEPLR